MNNITKYYYLETSSVSLDYNNNNNNNKDKDKLKYSDLLLCQSIIFVHFFNYELKNVK